MINLEWNYGIEYLQASTEVEAMIFLAGMEA